MRNISINSRQMAWYLFHWTQCFNLPMACALALFLTCGPVHSSGGNDKAPAQVGPSGQQEHPDLNEDCQIPVGPDAAKNNILDLTPVIQNLPFDPQSAPGAESVYLLPTGDGYRFNVTPRDASNPSYESYLVKPNIQGNMLIPNRLLGPELSQLLGFQGLPQVQIPNPEKLIELLEKVPSLKGRFKTVKGIVEQNEFMEFAEQGIIPLALPELQEHRDQYQNVVHDLINHFAVQALMPQEWHEHKKIVAKFFSKARLWPKSGKCKDDDCKLLERELSSLMSEFLYKYDAIHGNFSYALDSLENKNNNIDADMDQRFLIAQRMLITTKWTLGPLELSSSENIKESFDAMLLGGRNYRSFIDKYKDQILNDVISELPNIPNIKYPASADELKAIIAKRRQKLIAEIKEVLENEKKKENIKEAPGVNASGSGLEFAQQN